MKHLSQVCRNSKPASSKQLRSRLNCDVFSDNVGWSTSEEKRNQINAVILWKTVRERSDEETFEKHCVTLKHCCVQKFRDKYTVQTFAKQNICSKLDYRMNTLAFV